MAMRWRFFVLCSDASYSDGDVRKKQRCDAMAMRLEALVESHFFVNQFSPTVFPLTVTHGLLTLAQRGE